MYITRAFINDRLYASDPSSTAVVNSRRFLSVVGNDGFDLPRRYWSRYSRRSPSFRLEEKSDRMGGMVPTSKTGSLPKTRWGSGRVIWMG